MKHAICMAAHVPKTPMLKQYFSLKEEHPGVMIAIRVGDFYEFYGEDAETAASVLEITLTGREDGGTRIPMAGVPYHSVEKYLARLLKAGHKVAICDQLEDPKQAKGLVKRGITRVMTPGTVVEDSLLEAGRNNFLAALCGIDGRLGFSLLDSSTGEFWVTEISGDGARDRLLQELARVRPTELLLGKDVDDFGEIARVTLGSSTTELTQPRLEQAVSKLKERLQAVALGGFGLEDKPVATIAASMVVHYAERNHLNLEHVTSLTTYSVDGFMRLDASTRRSLELSQNLSDGGRRFTLLSVIDCTRTPMGARLMRRWVEQPLIDPVAIGRRLDSVERLLGSSIHRGDVRSALGRIGDLERLVARCATGTAGPRDLAGLSAALGALPAVISPAEKLGYAGAAELLSQIQDLLELQVVLNRAIVPDPPHTLRDGGVIRAGYDPELDALRELSKDGKGFIASIESKERQSTGIASLKIGFNSVFGYFIEVGKANVDKVPEHYIRKQTTANAERYITAELKDRESQVLGAEEKATSLESDLFHRLRARAASCAGQILALARNLAELDVLSSFAESASEGRWTRPRFTEADILNIEAGRHPVVEASTPGFVPNDLTLNPEHPRVLILTGPNMAGKSTYLRQTALIVLMAQIGCYVPCKSAELGICDRIFARIGAKDELATGQSTFMVEMVESANILNHASSKSLVILDEVGRGTSTFDGLAIAWAMVEHLVKTGPKTLFATHYHQLNALAESIPEVANFRVAVEEFGDEIVWTHRVVPGGADRSYGVHVARMAGVPGAVLSRANEILRGLEQTGAAPALPPGPNRVQLTLFDVEPPAVLKELGELDVNQLTPMDALKLIDAWKRKFGR